MLNEQTLFGKHDKVEAADDDIFGNNQTGAPEDEGVPF
jgi:hypothetical protein